MSGMIDTLSRHEDGIGTGSGARPPAAGRLNLLERLLALILTALALCLHGLNFANVGGFWRDEANSITLALIPDLGNFWTALQYDSFPVLHYLIIRAWALLFGPGDTSLRLLGLIVGILLIAALWLKSIGLGEKAPLVSLLLVGLNPVIVRSLDALRPNGLASLATVLAFTAVWCMVRRTDAVRLTMATVILLCCAQLLFQSAIFILALGLAAMITGYFRGGWRRVALLGVPFVITALSLVPYIGHLKVTAQWAPVAAALPDSKVLLPGLLKVVNASASWMGWIWLGLAGLATCGMVWGMWRSFPIRDNRDRFELTLYCGVTIVTATAAFMLFIAKGVGVSPQPWHYMPLLVLLVVAAEPLIRHCFEVGRRRIVLLLLAVVSAAATIFPSARQLQSRMTSMDLVASAIARAAGPDDLIVLVPWYNGVSFSRYYHGKAPWVSFPALKENSVHRYDLLKEKMVHPERITDDLAVITATLQHGGKIWVVGSAFAMEPGTQINPLPPAPLPRSGWSSVPYLSNWNKLLLATLADRSGGGEQLSINTPWKFSQESPLIMVFQGYK
ncbi:MAG TPA: hypothetical protein VFF53_09620 [Geobacteraceae bacterium]|nr:hypothetical protein [Geobacteraceae bacterium]